MIEQNYYKKHAFICTNLKENGQCCGKHAISKELALKLKNITKERNISGHNAVRISFSGCLGRCKEGPVAVLYPEGRWFNLLSEEDVNNLINMVLTV
ncbi:Ferredoxin, 2Fe-2S [Rickettsiales bacterium Ac37b]|nr:Ferredoxin, 2Fe-2S [Rickettsiales bacterium Ac37b]